MLQGIVIWMLPLTFGCGSENLIPPPLPDQVDLYWDLELNHHAVALSTTAPYDTLQLVATPRNFRGEALAGLPAVEYVSRDPERVVVSPDGMLVGVAPTGEPVVVDAILAAGNLRHRDTVLVSVVADPAPPVLDSFSVHPLPPDSAKVSATPGGYSFQQPLDTLPVRAVTADGELIPIYPWAGSGSLPVYFRSSDPTRAKVNSVTGVVEGRRPGPVTIYASTTAFGITKADTLPYSIGLPVVMLNIVGQYSSDGPFISVFPDIRIGTGGAIAWWYGGADTVDITFADADLANVAAIRPVFDRITALIGWSSALFCAFDCDNGGNFTLSAGTPYVGRYFPTPGTYEYHSTRHGLTGRVVVVDER